MKGIKIGGAYDAIFNRSNCLCGLSTYEFEKIHGYETNHTVICRNCKRYWRDLRNGTYKLIESEVDKL